MPRIMRTDQKITVYLGLGGNLGDPLAAFRRTRQKLGAHPAIADCRSSPLYLTPPVGGPAGQPDYLNAVLELRTELEPAELLTFCQSLENAEGRERRLRWGPRTLDIDLLLYGMRLIGRANLEIPHPQLLERQFVLLPLLALAPELCHPASGLKLRAQLDRLPILENIRLLRLDW